jgi:DNA-binding NtrC family response regulator
MTILSEKRELTAVDLAELMPQLMKRNLPAIRQQDQAGGTGGFQEREILYKVLFDMKEDMTQLKNLIADLIRSNDLSVRDMARVQSLSLPGNYPAAAAEVDRFAADEGHVATEAYDLRDLDNAATNHDRTSNFRGGAAVVTERSRNAGARNGQRQSGPAPVFHRPSEDNNPILVDPSMQRAYAESEVVDEDLSLANAEKELIKKALRKHKSRRKEAAAELGISERTLYRKIKEYEVEE